MHLRKRCKHKSTPRLAEQDLAATGATEAADRLVVG